MAVGKLPVRSCLIDGEAIVCDENGLAVFDLMFPEGVFYLGEAHLRRHRDCTAHQAGRPITFLFAVFIIIVWAATGPIFHYSDTWQLIVIGATARIKSVARD
jgi:Low affinity iron permease